MSISLNRTAFDAAFGFLDAPDIERHPKEWWTAMDKHSNRRYDPTKPLPFHHYHGHSEEYFQDQINEDVIMEFVAARRFTVKSQLHTSQMFVDILTEQDFEQKWTALSRDEREKHHLNAFLSNEKHITYSPFVKSKGDCPELNRDLILADNGRGFIELMRLCTLSDISEVPSQPMIIENARFDEIIGYIPDDTSKTRAAHINMARVVRTWYIVGFVQVTVASYHGIEVQYQLSTTEHSKTKSTLKSNALMLESLMGRAASKAFQKEETKRRKEMVLHCQVCLKPEEKEKTGKMTVCSRCKTIGREIRYCGRTCQTADWKTHKLECGKPLDISAAFENINISGSQRDRKGRPDIPPCPPGHRRTPHIIRHIEHLETHPLKDYLRDFDGDEFTGFSLDEVSGAAIFIHMRNILFTTTASPKAEGALLYLYRVMQNYVPGGGGERGTQEQLKREYGLPLWNRMQELLKKSAPYEAPEISCPEIEIVLGWLKQTCRFKEELTAWHRGDGPTIIMASMVGPQKDVMSEAHFPEDASPKPSYLSPMAHFRKVTGALAVGPNFHIPELVDHPEDHFHHSEFSNFSDQIKYLQMNPQADYMIWGHPDSPHMPMAFSFPDLQSALAFLTYRYLIFENGGYEIEALVYFIMVLRPALRRKKVPEEVLLRQLSREYHPGYVQMALGSISRRESDGKEVYTSRRTGRVYDLGQIPLRQTDDTKKMIHWLKESGRFPEILRGLKPLER